MRGDIEQIIKAFRNGRKWYHEQGTVWKTGFLLHGKPGTGKTSLAAALAREFRCDIYYLPLTGLTDNNLTRLNQDMKGKGVVLIEDADTYEVLHDRKKKKQAQQQPAPKKKSKQKMPGPGDTQIKKKDNDDLTLATVLNVLDGVMSTSATGRVFIMTTNDLAKIDPAVYRPGRLDHHYDMSRTSTANVMKTFDMYGSAGNTFKKRLDKERGRLVNLVDKGM